MTPACARCGFEIDREEFVYSAKHMLRVRCAAGEEWICEQHRTPDQEILEVVKTGAAEQARARAASGISMMRTAPSALATRATASLASTVTLFWKYPPAIAIRNPPISRPTSAVTGSAGRVVHAASSASGPCIAS